MAAPSEAISLRWVEGAERVCRRCDTKITNLAKQVGEVRTVFPSGKRDILCMECHLTRSKWLGPKTPPLYVRSA